MAKAPAQKRNAAKHLKKRRKRGLKVSASSTPDSFTSALRGKNRPDQKAAQRASRGRARRNSRDFDSVSIVFWDNAKL